MIKLIREKENQQIKVNRLQFVEKIVVQITPYDYDSKKNHKFQYGFPADQDIDNIDSLIFDYRDRYVTIVFENGNKILDLEADIVRYYPW